MNRSLSRAALFSVALASACASGPVKKLPPTDPTIALAQAGKKIDFAITETKQMIQRSRGTDYLPDLYMRLAELYVERARYAWLTVYERRKAKGEQGRAFDVPEARLLKDSAIGIYDRLLREFPKFQRGDEALFLMAHEYRELGDFDAMKTTYERLIDNYPRSPHRLDAYLVLGDSAFDKSNLSRAEQYYNMVLAAPESPVHQLARYKLGWVYVNRDNCKGAVRLFEKILREKNVPRETKSLVSTQRSINIARESLVDLAYCYPEVYPEKSAPPYFRTLAVGSSDYLAAMKRVASRFFVKQMYPQATSALRELLSAAVSDEEAVETVRKLYDNLMKGKVFDRPAADVERIGRVLENRYYDYRVPKDKRDKLQAEFEVYARDIATRAHLAAKEQKTPSLYASAAAGYSAYLNYFPNSMARLDIEQNRAEAYQSAGQLFEAARGFERVQAMAKAEEQKHQARLNALSSYQQALEKGGLNRMERLIARGGIRVIGRLVIRDTPSDPNLLSIKLSYARSYYDQGEYARAAELFYALARQYPGSNEGVVGAHLALDALRLGEDLEGLATLGRHILGNPKLGDDKFKAEIKDIVAKTEQRRVTELAITGGNDREEQLLAMAKRNKGSELGEQALYNALLVARSSGDIDRFYELGNDFLGQYPKSSRRIDVSGALAQVATDRADFRQAAQYLEAAYAADPNGKEAGERLYTSATIRALLADAGVSSDLKKLITKGSSKVDELLLLAAKSDNLTAVEEVLTSAPVSTPVATFLRGLLAYQRGDRDEAAQKLGEAARERGSSEAGQEAVARARFLLGELANDAFNALAPSADIAKTVTEKSELLVATDRAYSQAIAAHDAHWALASLARVADAYGRFASFMRDLKLPAEVSAEEAQQIKAALGAKAAEAQKRAGELRAACAKKAKEVLVFSEAAKSCMTEQPFPEKVSMFPHGGGRHANEPPNAAPLRQTLTKNSHNLEALTKLAEAYLGTGDVGMALLVLDRADDIDTKSSAVQNLRGVALERYGDSDAAYAAFAKAVALDGSNTRARRNLAAQLAQFGYFDRARAELKKAGGAGAPTGDPAEHPEIGALGRLGEGGESR